VVSDLVGGIQSPLSPVKSQGLYQADQSLLASRTRVREQIRDPPVCRLPFCHVSYPIVTSSGLAVGKRIGGISQLWQVHIGVHTMRQVLVYYTNARPPCKWKFEANQLTLSYPTSDQSVTV
jgi:hypothetical protein